MSVTAFNNNAEFAQISDVTFTTKSGGNQFHGSELKLRGRNGRSAASHIVRIDVSLGSYTWAKNISNAQGSDAPTAFAGEEPYAVDIADRFNLRYDRGNVVGTPRQRFLLSGTYQLPFGSGRHWSGSGKILNAAIGGWSLSTVTQLQTGQWLTPIMSPASDQSNTNLNNLRFLGGGIARPDCVGNPVPKNRSPQNHYDLNSFAFPTPDVLASA